MDKNKRNLLITVIVIIAVFAVALVAYNVLAGQQESSVSYVPDASRLEELAAEQEAAAPVVPEVPVQEAEAPEPEGEGEDEQSAKMPDIPLTLLDGTETSFDAVRDGRPAIVNYFASWCPPCKNELPHFLDAHATYGDKVAFIFLDALDGSRETLETVSAFVEDFPITAPVYYDDGTFAYLFNTNSLPTTVFFDADGNVVKGYLGMVSEDTLLAGIDEVLGQ